MEAPARSTRRRIELRDYYDIGEAPVEIVPNAAETSLFHPLPEAERQVWRVQNGLKGEDVVLIFSGEWALRGLDSARLRSNKFSPLYSSQSQVQAFSRSIPMNLSGVNQARLSSVENEVPVASRLKARHGSFDIFRAVGAFGVIFIHISSLVDDQVTLAVQIIQAFLGCVVPFFLVTAFYFAARREKAGQVVPWRDFVVARATRLLVPFAFWGVIYTSLRTSLYVAGHQKEKLAELFADPVGLVLMNGGAVMLYFLPLLFVGLLLLHGLAPLLNRLSMVALIALFVVSSALKMAMDISGNDFNFHHAFQALTAQLAARWGWVDLNSWLPVRILLVLLADVLRCAPLITFAFIVLRLIHPAGSPASQTRFKSLLFWVSLAILTSSVILLGFGGPQWAIYSSDVTALAILLLSIALTDMLPANALTSRLGAYTFGIYLSHQVVITFFRLILSKHLPRPTNLLIAAILALAVFGISCFVTTLAARGGSFSRRLFAIEG